ncbi:hypothetical protein L6R52_28160, partial [Myxococcota bacterium]|nr:hypothetical protein [Myxococcota bacterium]
GVITDAGPRDASAPDASAPDAAMAPDATVDAGTLADAGVDAGQPDTGVWRPFAANSPWNTPIGPSPAIDPDSPHQIDRLATSSQWSWLSIAIDQYSVPVYFIDAATTPLVPVTVTRLAGEGFRTSPSAPIPAGAAPAAGTDAHLALVDRATGQEWDFWQAANGAGWTCGVCATADTLGSGVRPYPQQGRMDWWRSHGARACGFPLTAGLITVEEIQAGRIDHALVIGYPGIRSRYFTPPASTAQATAGPLIPTDGIPCGGRIQLDPSIDVTTLGLSPAGVVIARALQEYGAYVGDGNGSVALYADASPAARAVWSSGVLRSNDLRTLINLRSFRLLQLGQLYDDGN